MLDIGAHLGYFTVLAGMIAINGRVHSIEIDPRKAQKIQTACELTGTSAHTTIVSAAVAKKGGQFVAFAAEQVGNTSTNTVSGEMMQSQFIVPTLSLDEYCEYTGTRPDFLKIDIEGTEFEALEGLERTLSNLQPKVLCEVHANSVLSKNVDIPQWLGYVASLLTKRTMVIVDHRRGANTGESISDVQGDTVSALVGRQKPFVVAFL